MIVSDPPSTLREVSTLYADHDNRIAQLIERHARAIFIAIALLYLVCFNGQWRIGLDSANYRGLADSIANGRGYVFGEWAGKNIYPGLPVMLAGLQKVFGDNPVPPLIVMLAMSVATMIVTYRLIALHYPKWITVTITAGVATNAWFLQQSYELMTDMPFLLGVVTALYGWDLLRTRASKPRAMIWLIAGLALAASMRPTFLTLVAAWGITCAAGIVFGLAPSRKFYAICLTAMLAVLLIGFVVDPRVQGFKPFSGGYEREAIELIPGEENSRFLKLVRVLNKQLPAGFFGESLSLGSIRIGEQRVSPSSIIGSLLVVGSVALIARKHLLWALLAWLTILTTIVVSDEPRYYLMALPILLLAWLTMLLKLSAKLPPRGREMALAVGLAIVTLNNVSAWVSFLREQRSTPFVQKYSKGKYVHVIRMAEIIKEKVQPGEKVLGPSGSVLSYLSGRHVLTQREILPRRGHVKEFPQILHAKGIQWAVFPATMYRDKEPALSRMMERGIMRGGRRIGSAGPMRLARLHVQVPQDDWTNLPKLSSGVIETPPR